MKKGFVLLNLLALGLVIGAFLLLKVTVLDQAVVVNYPSTQTTTQKPPEDKSGGIKDKATDTSPHGAQNYDNLTPEQLQKQADVAEENVKIALAQFLMLEVKSGLMTMDSASELQKKIYQALSEKKSMLPKSQNPDPQSEL